MDLDPVRQRLLMLMQERTPPTDMRATSLAIGRNASYIHQFLFKGKPRKLPEDAVVPLAEYLHCSAHELRHEGRPENRGRPPSNPPPMPLPAHGMVRVPEISLRSFTGKTVLNAKPTAMAEHWAIPEPVVRYELRARPESLRMLVVDDDAMEPYLLKGDRVLIDVSWTVPTPPGIFVIWDGIGATVRRLEYVMGSEPPRVLVLSDNPAYTPCERLLGDLHLFGRVIWCARRV